MFLHNSREAQIKEIQAKTGLDFKIQKVALDMKWGKGGHLPTNQFALRNPKNGQVLNIVGRGYHVTQNEDIIGLVLDGISEFGSKLSIQSGGSLGGGKKVYLQLAIETDGFVNGDTIKRYITIIDSNDGSTALSVGIGNLTMSCQNQFYKFSKAGQSRFRHTASMETRIKEIPFLIKEALTQSNRIIKTYNAFESTACSRDLSHKLVNALLGYDKLTMTHKEYSNLTTRAENNMNTLYYHIDKEMNQKGNNLWGLHSGITSWTTHDKQAPKRENGRIESLISGTNYKTNLMSLEFAMEQGGIIL